MISRGFSLKKIVPKPWRRAVVIIAGLFLLAVIPGAYFALQNPSAAQAAWFDNSWAFRKKIPITTHASLETNVYFTVTVDTSDTSKFQADCGDMRFTDAFGKLLNYFIVSGCGTGSTVTHVLVPNFPAGIQNFYLYYGNPAANNGFSRADFASAATVTVGSVATEEVGANPTLFYKFEEGTGTTTKDSSSNSNSGTLGGATVPTWQSDQCISGKCLFFDGATSKVTGSKVSSGLQTVAFWIRPNSIGTQGILNLDGGTHKISTSGLGVITATGFASPTYYVNGAATTTPTLVLNQWSYVEITTATPFNTTSSFTLGTDGTNFIKGFIDEVKFYNYARSTTQSKADAVQSMAAAGSGSSIGFQPQSALSNGLVGYWKLDEASGVTKNCTASPFIDSSGNGNNGKSCPSTTGPDGGTIGKIGGAVTFDGSNDYIDVANATSLHPGDTFTLSAWVKRSSSGTFDAIFGTVTNDYQLAFVNDNIKLSKQSIGDVFISTSTYTDTTSWHHIVAVKNGSISTKVYYDGVEIAGTYADKTITAGSSSIYIGGDGNGGDVFAGSIDEARIYNRALSTQEVRQLYNYAPAPVAYWNMEESSGNSIFDITGNGNTGTLINSPQRVPGKFGKGLYFSGQSAIVDLGNSASIGLTKGITVEAWVNKDAASPTGNPNIVSKTSSGDNITYLLYYDASVTNVRFLVGDNAAGLSGIAQTAIPTSGVWHHIVGTADGTNVKIYIDGVLKNTQAQAITIVNGARSACIGGYSGAANCDVAKLGGAVDDVRIYDYARTAEQILDDMNHPLGGSSPLNSPLIYTKLDEQTGNTQHNSGSMAGNFDGSSSGPTWASGSSCKVNGCMVFGTNNDLITWGDVDFTDSLPTFSTSFWMNPSALGTNRNIISKANSTTQRVFEIKTDTVTSSEIQVMIAANSTDTSNYCTTAGFGLATSTWQHLTVVYDGNQAATNRVKVYKNGKSIPCNITGTIPTSFVAAGTTSNLKFGQGDDSINALFSSYDEIKIYNQALNPDQVALDYNLGSGNTSGGVLGTTEAADINLDGAGAAPVGYWNFDEKYGTSAKDKSGNNNTMTLNNGPAWTTGKVGSGLSFDGSNDYIEKSSAVNMPIGASARTVEAWVKYDGSLAYQYIFSYGTQSSTQWMGLALGSSGELNLDFWGDDASGTASNIADNRWHHIAATYNGNTSVSFYIDGKFKETVTIASQANTSGTTTRIGSSTSNDFFFKGSLDEVKIYNYARSVGQIAYDYNRGAPIAWWKLDDCQGTSIFDSSGNGSTGTLSVGGGGLYTAPGSCTSGTSTDSWYSGRTGKFNSSIIMDTNDTITMGNPSILQMERTDPRTFSIWIKTTSNTSQSLITKQADAAPYAGYNVQVGGVGAIDFQLVNTYPTNNLEMRTSADTNYYDGNWHMITVTYDGTSTAAGVKIYFDTKSQPLTIASQNLTSSIATSANFYLGSRSGTGQQFPGQLDDARIYPYAMSANQVKKLYNDGAAVYYGPATGAP